MPLGILQNRTKFESEDRLGEVSFVTAFIPNFMKIVRPARDCEHDICTVVLNFNLIFHMLCLDWAEKTAVGWQRTVGSPES